ncbi:Beta-barrel assembly-enhancing protease [subsurface metagenome]
MGALRKSLHYGLGMVVFLALALILGCSMFKRAPSEEADEGGAPTSVEQDSTEKKPAPSEAKPSATARSQQPSAQQRRPTTGQPSTSRQPARRPARRPAPRRKAYTSAELKDMASDIASLGNQLTALNRRTARRLSQLAPPDSLASRSIPRDRRYRFAGDYRQLQRLIRQHEDHPEDLATLVALADLQRRNYKLHEAEAYLLKALALEPLNQGMLFDLGYLYLEKGEYTKALGTFQEIIYLNPESIEARLAQGLVREKEGNYQRAETSYLKVEEQFGAVAGVYFHRALNLAARGDYGAAVNLTREGLTLYPDHAPLYYARGRAYAGLGLLDRAKTDFYDALSLDADLLEAYTALGEVSLQEGNATTAVRVFLRLLEEQPGDAAASLNLGRAYLMDLKLQEAAQELEMLQYLHPEDREVDIWLAQVYYLYSLELKDRGRFREALDAHNKAISLSAGQSPGWVVTALANAGTAARAYDDFQRSIDYFQAAIENDPFRADSYVGLSRTYKAMQDTSLARAVLRQALAIDPSHPAARVELNRITGP